MSNYPLLQAYRRTGYRLFCRLIVCVLANEAYADRPADQCLLDTLALADDKVTVGEVRAQCIATASPPTSRNANGATTGVVTERIAAEAEILERPFALTEHRPNYILPYTYNSQPNEEAFRLVNPDQSIDSAEAQLQVSFKIPLAQRLFNRSNDLFFSYTTRAWWQVYNDDISSPFRETDYEPELFLRHYGGPQLGPIKIAGWDLGLAHQSNGQSKPLSRSWNRVNANLAIETGNLAVALRTWYRIPENASDDDNPNLHRYLGYGDVRLLYRYRNNVFTAMVRPGTEKSAGLF